MSTRFYVEYIDGWRLNREPEEDEWELLDEQGKCAIYDPIVRSDVIFVGEIRGLDGNESFIIEANDLWAINHNVPEPPFSPEEWERGRWFVGYWS